MSLIITYIGAQGCVMAGDKRRIAFFGDKSNREILEEELYSGKIENESQLKKRATELEITLKITDDAVKLRSLGKVVVGEVSSKSSFETKRRRIYATTNGFQIIELTGSNITKMDKGESSIIVFGNKFTKKTASKILKKYWKSKTTLKEIETIFQKVLHEVSEKTPSVGSSCDLFIKTPALDKKESQKILRETVVRDVKLLQKWRQKLKKDLLEKAEAINMASRILTQGEVGRVVNVDEDRLEIVLGKDVQAFDVNWKQLASPGDKVMMFFNGEGDIIEGDLVVIDNERLCLKRNQSPLRCDIILCKSD